ncbi:hypothetical protein [Desmonostoc muscorum]|nr:hypothetical protein [Desmonostoc muscorum]
MKNRKVLQMASLPNQGLSAFSTQKSESSYDWLQGFIIMFS